jgi:hypothetical protein
MRNNNEIILALNQCQWPGVIDNVNNVVKVMKWQKYWRNVKIIMAKNGGNENNNGEMASANQCGGWP